METKVFRSVALFVLKNIICSERITIGTIGKLGIAYYLVHVWVVYMKERICKQQDTN